MANEFKIRKGLIVHGSGSSGDETVLDVQGNSGQLFSVTDSLTGDLFTVSDISGIPVLNANSRGSIVGGISTTLTSGSLQEGISSVSGDKADWDDFYVQGDILRDQPLGESVAYGDLLCLGDDLLWEKVVQTDESSGKRMLGMSLGTSDTTTDVLIRGFMQTTNAGGVSENGLPLYIRDGATGQINPNAPTSRVVRVVGHCYHTTSTNNTGKIIIYFNPDNSWIYI